jgi:hypothetical protein
VGARDCVVDFYCHKAALVLEVDGDIHDLQREEDATPLSFPLRGPSADIPPFSQVKFRY